MKKVSALQKNETIARSPQERKFNRQVERILVRVTDSSRSAVKSALREIRDLANAINTSLIKSYEADQLIQQRKEKLARQRFYL